MSIPGFRTVLFLAVCLGVAVQSVAASGLHRQSPKSTIMSGRIVAEVRTEGLTSFGLNYQSYVFEVETRNKPVTRSFIKFSYRFDQREPRLPKSFFDYSLTHKFRMTREEECDESWEGISSRFEFDNAGNFRSKQSALVYAKDAPVPQLDPHVTLACYIGTPHDYLASVPDGSPQAKTPIAHPDPAVHPGSQESNSAKAVTPAIASTKKGE
jgi:hypothetical protein